MLTIIKINDIFSDLTQENNRLFNELLFANNYCTVLEALNARSTHICHTLSHLIPDEDIAALDELQRQVTAVGDRRDGQLSVSRSIGDVLNDITDRKRSGGDDCRNGSHEQQLIERQTQSDDNYNHNKTSTEGTENSVTKRTDSSQLKSATNKTPTKASAKRSPQTTTAAEDGSVVVKWRCDRDECFGRRFATKARLRYHKKLHTNTAMKERHVRRLELKNQCYDTVTESYVCSQSDCGHRAFATRHGLLEHMRTVHTARRVPCDWPDCTKSYKSVRSLRVHRLAAHEGQKPYQCGYEGCGHRSYTKNHLNIHTARHSETRPRMECLEPDCTATFFTPTGLKHHQNRVHAADTAQTFRCLFPGCGRKYSAARALTLHTATHYTEPTLTCGYDGCAELFRTEHYRLKHRALVHQGLSVYAKSKRRPIHACEWPGCDFTGPVDRLAHHKSIHTGAKRFACDWPDCGKSFRLQKCLNDHRNVHNNVRPHACHWPGCQYRSANSGNVFKHVKLRHNTTTSSSPEL